MNKHRLTSRRAFFIVAFCWSLTGARLQAASGMWNLNPVDGDWNAPLHWSSLSVPNGPADIASFGLSNVTNVFLSANTEVDGIVFNPGASAYTIAARPTFTLTFSGAGISNNSGIMQRFVAEVNEAGDFGAIDFSNQATAGSGTLFTARGAPINATTVEFPPGGLISFRDYATAGEGSFTAEGGRFSAANGGALAFYNNASAGRGEFRVRGGEVLTAAGARIHFYDSATADHGTFTNHGGALSGGTFGAMGAEIIFHDDSSASAANFANEGGQANGSSGSYLRFLDHSTAGTATIVNSGGSAIRTSGGFTGFYDTSSAANAMITNQGGVPGAFNGGSTLFAFDSTANNATLIANGGLDGGPGGEILFQDDSDGGNARIKLFGNGYLDVTFHNGPGVAIGSMEGTGNVILGSNNLAVGSNNLSTVFSGVIQDGPPFNGVGGSLTKIGAGTLILSGTNIFTGPATVEAGNLILKGGSIASAVMVNGGTFGGSGTVGAVTVHDLGALSPGDGPGILNVAGHLTLALGSVYLVDLNGTAVGAQYDQTEVTGAIGIGGATLSLSLGFLPVPGMMFIIIKNDGAEAVAGTFNGLAEGVAFIVDGKTFTVSYQGGDGNDVILTSVVPEPATWALLTAGVVLLYSVWRRQRGCSS